MAENSDRNAANVLVYSDNAEFRKQVMFAVGRKVADDLPNINYVEAATWQGADVKVQEQNFDLLILDAETPKLGGIGFGKKVRDEYAPSMPLLVIVARPQDEWLARTAKPNAVVVQPIQPRKLADAVAGVLRQTLAK
ncbi:MAG: two-component system response regulator [Actinomycetaceae bacterium]|nr:two-component system response regulator [Arcanobacterium sp.]MDD7686357.1 two-component system response regulator [Actinomycetaceae bacterium]MDY5274216.1 two-component system response regulator [Arcanobacterium sp.]